MPTLPNRIALSQEWLKIEGSVIHITPATDATIYYCFMPTDSVPQPEQPAHTIALKYDEPFHLNLRDGEALFVKSGSEALLTISN